MRPAAVISTAHIRELRFLSCNEGGFHACPLTPPVETGKVTRLPSCPGLRRTQIPVGSDLASHGAQVVPKIDDRGATPEPIAVIDAVDHEARLEHERMRDHRIMLRICVLLDVEILLNGSFGVRKKDPLGS